MYSELRQGGRTDVCLWCDGDGSPEMRIIANANESSPGPTSKRAERDRLTIWSQN